MWSRCCSAASAGWSGRCSPAAISRRERCGDCVWLVCLALDRGASVRPARRIASTSSPAFRSSAISSAMSAATASASRRWSAPTATRMSTTPTPADAKKIADAKLVFVNGLGFEGWLPRLVQVLRQARPTIVTATIRHRAAQARLRTPIRMPGNRSPMRRSMWPISAMRWPRPIPPVPKPIEANASAYLAKLDALDREVREAVAQIPQDRRKVISTHDAFGYFAAAYGIEFIAPLGVSTESEASARDVAAIITQIRTAENPGGFSGKYQRSPADPADIGRDRRQGRRNAVFGQSDRRKGRCPHLH